MPPPQKGVFRRIRSGQRKIAILKQVSDIDNQVAELYKKKAELLHELVEINKELMPEG